MIYNTGTQQASLETAFRTSHPDGISGLGVGLSFDRTHISGTGAFNGAAFASSTEAINLFSRPVITFALSTALNSAFVVGERITPISHDDPRDGMTSASYSPRMFSYSRLVRNSTLDYSDDLDTRLNDYARVADFEYSTTYGGSPVADLALAYALRFGENSDGPTPNGDGDIILHIAFNLRLTNRASI
jgi:hypothetical protein